MIYHKTKPNQTLCNLTVEWMFDISHAKDYVKIHVLTFIIQRLELAFINTEKFIRQKKKLIQYKEGVGLYSYYTLVTG